MNTEIKDLNIYVKLAIAVVVIGGAIFGIYKITKTIKKAIEKKEEKQELDDAKDDLKELEKAGKGKTLSDSQISGFANSLKTAMDGTATDEDAIGRVFASMNNDADVLALIKAFGIQKLSGDWVADMQGTLSQCLTSELDPIEMKTYVTAHLIKKGIAFRF